MTGLLMVRQRLGVGDEAPWIVDGGQRVPGQDHNGRLSAVEAGLARHGAVRATDADAADADVDRILGALHERVYLDALASVAGDEAVVLPQLAPPGLEVDIPVATALVAAAREGVRTAVSAASRVASGDRFAYALCRPPGHHAGPAWLGGYCYLNTAAAAVQTLRQAGVRPVGVLDLDLHYPNGTSAIVAGMDDAELHSLHAWPVTNAPSDPVLPKSDREVLVEFRTPPDAPTYLRAVAASVRALRPRVAALVVSLGYDTIAGDPHGSWSLAPDVFADVGRIVASAELPVCVVQEGGYALEALADCAHAFATGLLEERGT